MQGPKSNAKGRAPGELGHVFSVPLLCCLLKGVQRRMAVWAGAGRANHQFSLYSVMHREEETKCPGHHQLPPDLASVPVSLQDS